MVAVDVAIEGASRHVVFETYAHGLLTGSANVQIDCNPRWHDFTAVRGEFAPTVVASEGPPERVVGGRNRLGISVFVIRPHRRWGTRRT